MLHDEKDFADVLEVTNHWPEVMRIILDYLGGPNLIPWALKAENFPWLEPDMKQKNESETSQALGGFDTCKD